MGHRSKTKKQFIQKIKKKKKLNNCKVLKNLNILYIKNKIITKEKKEIKKYKNSSTKKKKKKNYK